MADILKQNVGNKIIRQNQGGKIMKANYNFGKSLRGPDGYVIRFPIDLNPAPAYWTVQFWYIRNNTSTYKNDIVRFLNSGLGGSSRVIQDDGVSDRISAQSFAPSFIKRTPQGIPIFFTLRGNGSTIDIWESGFHPDVTSGFSWDISDFGYIDILTSEYNLMESFRFYNRYISDQEIRYFYNNGLGNEPLNSQGLLIDARLDRAIVADNLPKMKNLGGGGDGEFINLPAGTAQEKVDWANANLFVNFL